MGSFSGHGPLYNTVSELAVVAANDDRFMPVSLDELDELAFEISVLTPLRRINDPKEIVLGEHGIFIRQGLNTGTFLPQVATRTGWNVEEFLGHCAKDKVGIGWDGWKKAELYTFEAIVFRDGSPDNDQEVCTSI